MSKIQSKKPQLPNVPDYILKCATYQPGKPIEEVERELGIKNIIKLASNENPLGPSPMALQAIEKAAKVLHLYPDAGHFRLRAALSDLYNIEQEEIFIGNGSEEIFSLLIRSFGSKGDNIVSCASAFLAYRVCAQVHGLEYREPKFGNSIDQELDEILSLIDEKTKILFLPNPNNPTGTYLNKNQMQKLLDKVQGKNILVLLDYAYKEYCRADDLPGFLDFYETYPNLIVTSTFSKIYGLGGLRVGYGFAHKEILDPMRKVKMPFNVGALALAGAEASLSDHAHIKRSLEVNALGMSFLEQEFQKMGLEYLPSQGNFLLVKMSNDVPSLYQALLHKGVIVRPVAGYGLKEYLRFTVGLESENKKLISEIKELL
ncbi:MAG: histidinol-phosphate transaminase [Oligoflexia bacterium]|nr:histidinol-phosphate transaminase [Oligoflexia bacterium]